MKKYLLLLGFFAIFFGERAFCSGEGSSAANFFVINFRNDFSKPVDVECSVLYHDFGRPKGHERVEKVLPGESRMIDFNLEGDKISSVSGVVLAYSQRDDTTRETLGEVMEEGTGFHDVTLNKHGYFD